MRGWENLGIGHKSGLDCRKKDNSIILEIKNKYNTCNSNSQKTVYDKLSEYKKKYPKTRCILGIVNPRPNCSKLEEKIIHNEVQIEKIQGVKLLDLIFTSYTEDILEYTRNIMYPLEK